MDCTCISVLTTNTIIWLVRCFSSFVIFYYILTSQLLCTDFKRIVRIIKNYFKSVDIRLYIYIYVSKRIFGLSAARFGNKLN